MKSLIVDSKYDKKKLNTYLLAMFPDLSLNSLYKALRKKDIKVNGKRISENILIHSNDKVDVFIADIFLYSKKEFSINKIYEDDNILIINKPENIEILGENSLTYYIQKEYHNKKFPYPCHRLDRNTKGLIIYAKNQESLNILFRKFKNREIEKHYYCRVYGIPDKKQDTLEAYLFKDKKKSTV